MHKASTVLAAGADFRLMGFKTTQVKSIKPVVSVCAVRTGSGKSQTTRRVSLILRDMGYKVAAIRHPMPYGDLVKQKCSAMHPMPTWIKMNVRLKNARNMSRISIMASLSMPVGL